MTHPPLSLPSPASHPGRPITDREVVLYRALLGLAAIPIVGFGFVYRAVVPGVVDPWLDRFVVAGCCLAVVGLSYLRRWRAAFLPALHAAFVLITAWVLRLLWLNAFAAEYALGLLVVVSVISSIFPSPRTLAAYGVGTLLGASLVAAHDPAPRVSPVLFISYLVVILALFLVAVARRLRAERELAASEARYALAARGAQDGLWDWNVAAGTVFYSTRWKEIVGANDDAIGASPDEWLGRVHPDDRERLQTMLFRDAETSGSLFDLEHRVAHSDGTWRWVLVRGVRVVDVSGAVVRIAGSQKDISDHKRAEARLVHDALHDALTGLPNRSLFLDRLRQAIAHTKRNPDARFAVLFLDVDRFKVVNDRLGHIAGDKVLVAVSRRIQSALREGDTVARLGGDEFALLLDDIADPAPTAERLQDVLRAPFDIDGQHVAISASFGIAISSTGFARPEDVLRDADAAMYRAKARGRSRFEIADDELHAQSHQQLALESQLRGAAERGELRLYYQPIVRLHDRTIVGVEALLRWEHPERGLCLPNDFVPLAEQTGMIIGVGRWALHEACRQMQVWRELRAGCAPLWLSVNLSSRQMTSPHLADEIVSALDATGYPADRLRLEITESAIMDDPALVGTVLDTLRARGIRVAVDDFGTGYSSLAYLHRLPLDTLKIDRSFVHRMHDDPAQEAVVGTIVSLADRLHLDTVAEGVETEADATGLRHLGCELAQGFLFAPPLAPNALEALLPELASEPAER